MDRYSDNQLRDTMLTQREREQARDAIQTLLVYDRGSVERAQPKRRVPRIRNTQAYEYIARLEPFKGSHLWGGRVVKQIGDRINDLYIVNSYRVSYPILIYDYNDKVWCAVNESPSRTTSRHINNCAPEQFKPIYLSHPHMQAVALYGYTHGMLIMIETS